MFANMRTQLRARTHRVLARLRKTATDLDILQQENEYREDDKRRQRMLDELSLVFSDAAVAYTNLIRAYGNVAEVAEYYTAVTAADRKVQEYARTHRLRYSPVSITYKSPKVEPAAGVKSAAAAKKAKVYLNGMIGDCQALRDPSNDPEIQDVVRSLKAACFRARAIS